MTYSHFWLRHPSLDIKALTSMLNGFKQLMQISEEWESWRPSLATHGEWLAIDETVGTASVEAGKILSSLSADTQSDAFYYFSESVCDTFAYCHWKAGKHLRSLECLDIKGPSDWQLSWQVVEGEPEPWERDAFFTEKRLRAVLSEDHALRHGTTPEGRLAYEQYWQAGRIVQSQSEPYPRGARERFWGFVKHHELPTCYHGF